MFNKQANLKPLAAVKSSERKRWLVTACKNFGLDEQTLPSDVKSSLFPKDLKVGKIETHAGKRGSLIVDGHDKPIWINVRIHIHDILIPSIYTLWKAAYLLPRVLTVDNTIQFLENGADLMARGIFEPFPTNVKKGDVVAITTLGRPTVPIAVGVSLIDFEELAQIQSGKAVLIVSVINDTLYLKGAAAQRMDIPTELDLNVPIVAEEDQGVSHETGIEDGSTAQTQEPSPLLEPETKVDEIVEETNNMSIDDLNTDEIDRALKRSLLQVLKNSIEVPLELPLPSTTLSSLMMANLPFNHPSIQMKKSSWKKASKFFKLMEKEKLIKCRDRNGELVIQSINTEDPQVREFQLFKPAKPWTQPAATSVSGLNSKLDKLVLTEYWRPRSAAVDMFKKLKVDHNGYYTNDQLKQLLKQYLNTSLSKMIKQPKEKKFIIPDNELAKALKSTKETERIGRDKLIGLLQQSCQQFHTVTVPGQPESKLVKGGFPKVKLSTEKRTGTKVVTKIVGLEAFFIEPSEFADELRVACAGSSTVSPLREGSKQQQILIQGNHIKTIAKLLEDKGVRPNWID